MMPRAPGPVLIADCFAEMSADVIMRIVWPLSRRFILAVVAIVSFLVLGLVATEQLVAMRDRQERAHLMELIVMAAAGFTDQDLSTLHHDSRDIGTPAFHAVRSHLVHLRKANAKARFVYLLGQQGDDVIFYADAEAPTSDDYSAPGDVCEDASPAVRRAIMRGFAFVEGPDRDQWGVWVSGFAPVYDHTGTMVALLGMDIDVKDWQQTLSAYRYFGIGFSLFASVLLLLAVISAERIDGINAVLKREVTTRARIVDALRESEERYRSLIDLTPDIIYRLNEDGTIAFISAAITQLGYDPDELVGVPFDTLVHPEDRGKSRNHFVEYRVGDRRMKNLEVRLISKADHKRALDFEMHYRTIALHARGHWDVPDEEITRPDKHFISTQGIARDVSERRRADVQLRKLSHAIEMSPAIVVITDREGVIEFANPAFSAVTGYTLEEAMGQNPRFLASGVHPREFYVAMWETILAGEVWHGEFCNTTKSGALIWETTAIAPVRGEDDTITNFVAIKVDITARKRAEEELHVAIAAAEAANRAKSAFLANMSHEIRTPMNAILGFSQLMLRDPSLTTAQLRHLETINRSGEHLLALINDILEMSKIEAGRITLNPATFDLHALIDDMAMMFRLRADAKHLRLTITRDECVPHYATTDENKLRQILINLIGNAVKFTETGSITVRVHTTGDADALRLHLEVEDTGPGIPESELGKLFRPFVQTSVGAHAEAGTGLGLVISREFARLMHGDITLASQVGVGTTFTVEIGITVGDATALVCGEEFRRVRALQPDQSPRRILVADDREENRVLLCEMLSMVGFATRQAENGAVALREFDAWQPHLILMDMRMPVMDGYEAIRRIRAREDGTVPIIAVTASALTVSRAEMLRCGADDLLNKPFRDVELYEMLRAHLDVAYCYEDEAPAVETPAVDAPIILVGCSDALRAQLREAALDADRDRLLELITQCDATVAPALTALAQRFDYEGVLAILDREGATL